MGGFNAYDVAPRKEMQEEQLARPRRPLFNIEVKHRADKPPDLLIVHEGETACEAAADFAAKHALPFEAAQRLRRMLEEHEELSASPSRCQLRGLPDGSRQLLPRNERTQ